MKTNEAVSALAALAHGSRLELFRQLVKAGKNGLSAGELSERLEIPKPTLSFHLKELTHAQLIFSERQGRSLIYRLETTTMSALLAFLSEDCCQGQPELCLPPLASCPSSNSNS